MWQFVASFPCQKAANGAISMTSRNKGIVLMVIGSLFAALMAALIKLSAGMPTLQKLFFRSLVGVVLPDLVPAVWKAICGGKTKNCFSCVECLAF